MALMLGFCKSEVKPFGPVHEKEIAPVAVAFRLIVPPSSTGELLEAVTKVGGVQVGVTITVVTVVAVQLSVDTTVRVYVPFAAKVAEVIIGF